MIDRRTNSSRRQNVKLVLASLAVLSACAHPNRPVSPIESDTLAYSSAISDARQEQLLMNIVRLRYNDPVTFVDAERITTTENTQINGMLASALALGGQNLDEVLNGNVGTNMSSQPSIAYSALRGSDYAQQILQPLPPATIFLMSQSGWSVERLMLCCVSRIGDLENARAAAGPTPPVMPDNTRFRELAALMRSLQERGQLMVQVVDPDTSETDGDGKPRVILKWDRTSELGQQLADFFRRYWVSDVSVIPGDRYITEISTRGNALGDYAARGRSLLGVLSALSQSVHVPEAHRDIARASQPVLEYSDDPCRAPGGWHDVNGGLFAVQSAAARPTTATIAVEYRDYWFYVDDRCHDAKETLNLLDHLYALQAGISSDATTLLLLGG
ncbi:MULTISPECIES: hypothetical protein [unclassified Hyphomonas]|jgi:hypothetical protein|uniref:hypothetical protein n=1 Tax=unclassified Hyphomonas TaxID=2630699 RepID=UPI000C891530|nr:MULTISPECIES: hypothetical protein [unclassified Hyphomonas]MAL44461.1 hypothetical protein [Hyphomonas sp.]MBO6581933.1 hypothetical protein [Hyphomonas sp.]MDF1807299.1 hypothetical protein [Hyphomonas sp.]HAO36717.1 hypothetical protein [Hyphomonas sp.]HAW55500.1 hypothetical protein [Hyphomonas sp.]|tara:strand:+ start:4994 stop:6154 length:1161 start_codon:yes stop_codon:yes gene_type:complete